MKKYQPDIVLLQQLNFVGNSSLNFPFLRNFSCLKYTSTTRGNGVGFMVNKNSIDLIESRTLQMGHTVMVKLMKRDSGREYYVFNVYAAVGHTRTEYEAQFRIIEKFIQDNNLLHHNNLIVAGDINLNLLEPSAHPHHYSRFKSLLRNLIFLMRPLKQIFIMFPPGGALGRGLGPKVVLMFFYVQKKTRNSILLIIRFTQARAVTTW